MSIKVPKSPAYLWYPRDIDSSGRVRSLTDLEELWYRRALDQSWMHEGVPKDPAVAAGWIGRNCTPESAEKILKMFFVCHKKDETKMVNPRQEEERKKLKQKSKLRAEAGRASGVKRRKKRDLDSEHLLNKTQTKSNIPIPISIQDISNEISEEYMSETSSDADAIFAYWQIVLNHQNAKFTAERKRLILARLKDGYTVPQLKSAIDGCRASPHHSGENDTGTVYDDLTLICRNGSKVEQFIGYLTRKETNGTGKQNNKRSDLDTIAESVEFYRNYPN